MKKYFLAILIFFFSSNLTISANGYSIFGGTYDYDDDNTTNLFGLNYHLSKNELNLSNILTINPVVGGFITAKSATMLYGGFETNFGTVDFKPGRVIVFNSLKSHRGLSTEKLNNLRMTLTWKSCSVELDKDSPLVL